MGVADHAAAVLSRDGDGFGAGGRPGVGDDGAGLPRVRLRRPGVGDGQGGRGRGDGGGEDVGRAGGARHRAGDVNVGQGVAVELVGPDIVARAVGPGLAVYVGGHPDIHPCVNRRRIGADVVVAAIGVHKGRVAPDVDRAGEDGSIAAPVGGVGPGPAAPERGLQAGRVARRDGDAHGVADQDGVVQNHGAGTRDMRDMDSTGVTTAITGDSGVLQPRGSGPDVQPAACDIGPIVGDDVVDQCGTGSIYEQPAAPFIGGVGGDGIPAKRGVARV